MIGFRFTTCLLAAISLLPWLAAGAVDRLTDSVDLHCDQEKSRLRCDYRVLDSEPVLDISAKSGDTTLPVQDLSAFPWSGATSAVLFVVDTSDPARQPVVEKNRQHIRSILQSIQPYHRIGLASFDNKLRLEVPIGRSSEQVLNKAAQLQATGKTTELYRSMLSAVELLARLDADRKSIYLFSDGLAEDKAYFHQDVVKAARRAGVVINSMGYLRSVPQSVALQTIRRLSEETGGVYIEADNRFSLPADFLAAPFSNIDNGGRIAVDLSPAMATDKTEQFSLIVETDLGSHAVTLPVQLLPVQLPEPARSATAEKSPTKPAPATKPASTRPAATKTPVQVVTRPEPAKINSWFWYGIPAALIILLLVTIITFLFLVFRRDSRRATRQDTFKDYKPFAYLVAQDETKRRYPITQATWRIGRSKDNELTLRDNSISRRHAEIHRDKGDVFTIMDLDSLNGIFINNTKVHRQRLREGDIIEIGDISLRFTLLSPEYSLEESTLMQNTRAPLTH